mgnify:CR=1 FL=1
MRPRSAVLSLVLLAVFALPALAGDTLTLATTTSTEQSGLLAYLHPDFEKATGITVKVIAKGTGASLQLARDGNCDVVLAHAEDMEMPLVNDGIVIRRRRVMYNDFILIGPDADPAGVRAAKDVSQAMQLLAEKMACFISRGDQSGTHFAEQKLWKSSGVALETPKADPAAQDKPAPAPRPSGDWYLSIGQGMGPTITMATEKRAYTLADRGTYYAFSEATPAKTDLKILVEGQEELKHIYAVMAVNPEKHPKANFKAAKTSVEWLSSPETMEKIEKFTVGGKVLFHAIRSEAPAPAQPKP